jgi:uncharacterized protein (DUF1499 family)
MWIAIGLAVIAAVALAGVLYVRLAPSDPARWHVDPLTAPGTGSPNSWRVLPAGAQGRRADAAAPRFQLPPEALAEAVDTYALSRPRTVRIAGGPDRMWMTYVQRSRWMRFPDYISVRVMPAGAGGSTLAIYSRARFGRSDLGVNRARVEKWLADLDALAQ